MEHISFPGIGRILRQPFAGDEFIAKRFLEIKQEYNIINIIETGTYIGATFIWLYNNFEKIFSCEINPDYYQNACDNIFGNNIALKREKYSEFIANPIDMGEMIIANLDSVSFINLVLRDLEGETMFFLDAHWYECCPLLDELKAIANHHIKPAVIVIHDFKTDHPEMLGFDSDGLQPFSLEWISPHVENIYGNAWTYEFNTPECASGARRGVIYIKRLNK